MKMRNVIGAALLAGLGTMVTLPAVAATMEARYGNTVLATRPDGTKIKLYFNADKTFTGEASPGSMPFSFDIAGTWRLDGDKLCVLQTEGRGRNKGIEKCEPLAGDKIGDSWTVDVTDRDGKTIVQSMSITQGR
jgi:hypothetical protein